MPGVRAPTACRLTGAERADLGAAVAALLTDVALAVDTVGVFDGILGVLVGCTTGVLVGCTLGVFDGCAVGVFDGTRVLLSLFF